MTSFLGQVAYFCFAREAAVLLAREREQRAIWLTMESALVAYFATEGEASDH
jgi:hypothetical protein